MKLSTTSYGGNSAGTTPVFVHHRRRSEACRPIGALALLLTVAACSGGTQPAATQALGSVPLAPAGPRDVPSSLVYRAPDLDTRPPPKCFYIPQTEVYTGKEAVFLDVTEQQKQTVANEVTRAFRRAIGGHQHVSPEAGPGCATLQLYLTGITKSIPGQDTDAGAYSNLIGQSSQGGRNLQASVNGTITVAGKFVAPDGSVLAGFVNKIGTNAFDIPSNASPRDIAALAADRIANDLARSVDREVAVQERNRSK